MLRFYLKIKNWNPSAEFGDFKYYHPQVAKGNLNWDQQLFKKINELERINDKAALNDLYSNWMASLGKVNECSECSQKLIKLTF
jgi:hypothetical protein